MSAGPPTGLAGRMEGTMTLEHAIKVASLDIISDLYLDARFTLPTAGSVWELRSRVHTQLYCIPMLPEFGLSLPLFRGGPLERPDGAYCTRSGVAVLNTVSSQQSDSIRSSELVNGYASTFHLIRPLDLFSCLLPPS